MSDKIAIRKLGRALETGIEVTPEAVSTALGVDKLEALRLLLVMFPEMHKSQNSSVEVRRTTYAVLPGALGYDLTVHRLETYLWSCGECTLDEWVPHSYEVEVNGKHAGKASFMEEAVILGITYAMTCRRKPTEPGHVKVDMAETLAHHYMHGISPSWTEITA